MMNASNAQVEESDKRATSPGHADAYQFRLGAGESLREKKHHKDGKWETLGMTKVIVRCGGNASPNKREMVFVLERPRRRSPSALHFPPRGTITFVIPGVSLLLSFECLFVEEATGATPSRAIGRLTVYEIESGHERTPQDFVLNCVSRPAATPADRRAGCGARRRRRIRPRVPHGRASARACSERAARAPRPLARQAVPI